MYTRFFLFVFIAVFLIIASCSPHIDDVKAIDSYNIVNIDGCEYIQFYTYYSKGYCHKGNCKNTIHKYNQSK